MRIIDWSSDVCSSDLVSNESDVARYAEATVGALGRIDVFFNNAGIEGKVAPLEEQDISMFDKVIAINVRGAYLGLKHVLPHMYKAGAGSVVNTSSVAGLDGSAGVLPYVTSKHALVGRSEEHTSELQSLMRIS